MNLINKSKLKHPKLFAGCTALFGIFGCVTVFNALRYGNSPSDFIYPSIPLLVAALFYAHLRFPTPRGWLALACLLLIPTSYETICGLSSIYLDLHVKYSWEKMLESLAMSAVVFIVIAWILYSAKVKNESA
jgi:hypothetical protein